MKRARLNKKGLAKFQDAGEFKKELRPIGSRGPKKPITLQGMSGMSLKELDKLKEAHGLHKSNLAKTEDFKKYEDDWKNLLERQQAFVTRIGDKYRRPSFKLNYDTLGLYYDHELFNEISPEDSAELQSLLDEEMNFSSPENFEMWEEMDWRDWHSDEIRHAYTSAATADKVSDALGKIPGYGGVLEYTGMNDVLGFLASNLLGAGHEAAFFKNQMSEEEDKYDYVRSGMNSAEDMWNNLLGAYIGATSDSEEEMEQKIRSYINEGITATGRVEPAEDPNTLGIKKALKNWVTNNSSDLEPAFEEYQKGGNWPDNRFMTLVDPKGRRSKSPRDPSLLIGAQTLAPVMRNTDDDIRTGRGYTINPALHTYVFDKDRDSELRGTLRNEMFWYQSPIEKDAYNQDILQGGVGAMADIDYTTLPQKRNMRNMAIDLGLDAGLGVGTMEVGPMYAYDKRNAGQLLPYGYLTGKAGLRDRRRGLQGNVFAGYGTPRSPQAGFRIGAEGSIPLITNKKGLKITANPSASYDFTSGAPRFGLNLGLNLPSRQQGGSTSTAQGGSLAEDVIGQIRLGVSPVKVYKDLLRQMIPADEIDNAFTQAGYDENTITQLQRQASKSITDELVDTSIAERGIKQAKSGRELLNKRKRLPKYQDLGEFPDPTGKFEAEYDQVNLEGEEMDDMNYQLPVAPSTASGSVGVNIPASSVATVTDVTPVTPVVKEQTQPEPEVAEKDIAYNPFGSGMASVEMADATPQNEAKMLKEMEEFRNIGAEPGGLRGFAGKVGDFVKSEGFQNFLDDYGTVGNIGVGVASLFNQFRRDREARDAKNQRRQMTPADMMYSMYEERDGDRGDVDVRSGIYQPDNLVAAMGMEMPSMMPPVIQEQIVDLDTETITRLISAGADIEML